MPSLPTYKRLLKQPLHVLQERVATLADAESSTKQGSVERRRKLRLLRAQIHLLLNPIAENQATIIKRGPCTSTSQVLAPRPHSR